MVNRELDSGLLGRSDECEVLDRLLTDVRSGHSRVLVLRGEAGVGKSALLEYVASGASGCRVLRQPAWSRRWSWPLPVCTSCARHC